MKLLSAMINGMTDRQTRIPDPFLSPVFQTGVEPVIATGFNYTKQEQSVHGVERHGAIDFDVPRGTPILAAADGYALCSYGELQLRMNDGSPRLLSLEAAQQGNPRNADLQLPAGASETDELPIFFGSYVVQIWHERGRYTQYAHLDGVAAEIPYHRPVQVEDEDKKPTGDLSFSPNLRLPVRQLRTSAVTRFVRRGQVIGWTGMTGCGWGGRCYDRARFDADGKPDFRGVEYPYYTSPHLHFMVFGPRAPRNRTPHLFDPFGLYSDASGRYPHRVADWGNTSSHAQHHSLWLGHSSSVLS